MQANLSTNSFQECIADWHILYHSIRFTLQHNWIYLQKYSIKKHDFSFTVYDIIKGLRHVLLPSIIYLTYLPLFVWYELTQQLIHYSLWTKCLTNQNGKLMNRIKLIWFTFSMWILHCHFDVKNNLEARFR